MGSLARIFNAWREDLRLAQQPPDLAEPVLQSAILRFSMAVLAPLAALLALAFAAVGAPPRTPALSALWLGLLWGALRRWPQSRKAVAWALGAGILGLIALAVETGRPISLAIVAVLAGLGIFMDGLGLGALLLGGSALIYYRVFQLADSQPAREAVMVHAGPALIMVVAAAGWYLGLRRVRHLLEGARAALQREAAERSRLVQALFEDVVSGAAQLDKALLAPQGPDWAEARRLLAQQSARTHSLRELRNRFADPELGLPAGTDFSVPVLRSLLWALVPLNLAGFYYHVVLGQGPLLVTPAMLLICAAGLLALRGRTQAPRAVAWMLVLSGPLVIGHDLLRDFGQTMTLTLGGWCATILNAALLLGRRPALGMLGLAAASIVASALALPSTPALWHQTGGLLFAVGVVSLVGLQSVQWQRAVLAQLEAERQRLATGLAQRRRLLGTLFHDIANPLAALEMLGELQRVAGAGPAEMARVRRLLGRLRDLLNESRHWLAEGAPAATATVPVDRLLSGVDDLFFERLRDKGLLLAQDVPAGLMVRAQEAALRDSVLSNLLSNAIKFSPPGSRLELSAARQGARTCIEVRDRGPGLSPAVRSHLAGGGDLPSLLGTAGEVGQGLGLGLAQEHVRRMGGELEFIERPEGGLVARVSLEAA